MRMEDEDSNSDRGDQRILGIGTPNLLYSDNKLISYKYNLWNFIPKNLYKQFRRLANFYFLCVSLLTVMIDSPVSPWASITPLIIVVSVSAVKQAYEDWLRHKVDRKINNKPVTVVRQGKFEEIPCKEVRVGDIVRVTNDTDIPCDMVIIKTSRLDSKCYVMTANLDGETNLKMLQCPLRGYLLRKELWGLNGQIKFENPTADLYSFTGAIEVEMDPEEISRHPAEFLNFDQITPRRWSSNLNQSSTTNFYRTALTTENLMLRGSALKNTQYILGCAVYTGRDTKLAYNSQSASQKVATSERSINFFLVFFFFLLVGEVLISVASDYYEATIGDNKIYLGQWQGFSFQYLSNEFFSYIVLYYYIIPISLYITVELQRFLGTLYFSWDNYMKYENFEASAKTSDINEDLGQVEYLFSDKTGTLTKNNMIFRKFSVDEELYSEIDGKIYDSSTSALPLELPENIETLFLAMALCHSVQCYDNIEAVLENTSPPDYEASSPDEKALVEAAARCGIVYLGEENNIIFVRKYQEILKFQKIKVVEFTSDRKKMSIIVADEDGRMLLFCKGAESAIAPVVIEGSLALIMKNSTLFAIQGLRTLLYAWKKMGNLGETSVIDIPEAEIECDLTILGVTAIEDQLQIHVTETLSLLKRADIKVWILTGDRMETAVNVALSCSHINPELPQLYLLGITSSESCVEQLSILRNKVENLTNPFSFVFDGTSLKQVVENKDFLSIMVEITMKAYAVLCCRLAPKQKAEIVRAVKHSKNKPVTAAIGDGANDIAMILEAQIGIGVVGKEGRQAINNADFVVPTFCDLQRVFLVHGHWYYIRLAVLVQYFFYKNVVFITPQVFFAIYNGVSPQPLYSSVFFLLYNTAFTSLPILVYSLLEQDYQAEKLVKTPELYKTLRRNALLSWKQFFIWFASGVWHSLVVYFLPCYLVMINPMVLIKDNPIDLSAFGTIVIHCSIIVVNLKILLESRYNTLYFVLSVLISIIGFGGFTLLYDKTDLSLLDPLYGVYTKLVMAPTIWLLTIVVVITSLIPDVIIKTIENMVFEQKEINHSQSLVYLVNKYIYKRKKLEISEEIALNVNDSE